MSSYLFVSFNSCGTLFKIQSFQDGVLAVLLLDGQQGFLDAPFFGQLRGLFRLPGFLRFVIGEEVQLHRLGLHCFLFRLIHHMIDAQVQPADEQVGLHNPVEKTDLCLGNQF